MGGQGEPGAVADTPPPAGGPGGFEMPLVYGQGPRPLPGETLEQFRNRMMREQEWRQLMGFGKKNFRSPSMRAGSSGGGGGGGGGYGGMLDLLNMTGGGGY
jgi:hypothetical protein